MKQSKPSKPRATRRQPRARFWIWANDGRVKLTLREGEHLSWSYYQPHEEGWHSEHHTWWLEDGVVWCGEEVLDRDCDGRFDHSTLHYCDISQLDSYQCRDGYRTPLWTKADQHQRDYAAEAAGY